jgi:competence protein ComEC
MDFNIFEVLLFYLFLLLFINYKTKILFVFMLLIIFIDLVLPYFDSSSYVYFFDVGQGDSSMIITPYRKEVILVDTGGVRNRNVSDDVISFMKSKGINSVDYMILSHGDFDHMGEAYNISKVMNIKNVIFNHNSFNELELDFIRYLDDSKINYFKGNNKLNITDNMRFLNDKVFDNENDNSIIFYLKLYNYSFLFTGDVGVDVEKYLIDNYNLTMIDVLKVAHHGSKTSSSKEFIDEISPKYSIISVGKNNRYGHPNNVVLDMLSKSKIYRTDIDGSVFFKINDDCLVVNKY